jgi:hypothetical protein
LQAPSEPSGQQPPHRRPSTTPPRCPGDDRAPGDVLSPLRRRSMRSVMARWIMASERSGRVS